MKERDPRRNVKDAHANNISADSSDVPSRHEMTRPRFTAGGPPSIAKMPSRFIHRGRPFHLPRRAAWH